MYKRAVRRYSENPDERDQLVPIEFDEEEEKEQGGKTNSEGRFGDMIRGA